jgi:glycosyltransferase involved in cell wall biosynthesis
MTFTSDQAMRAISIVIPLFNKAETAERAIASVLSQGPVVDEVVVVDDGSTDGSAAVVRRFGDRVRLLQQANAGPAFARNTGASHVTSKYIGFLDADDEYEEGALAGMVAAAEEEGARVVVGAFRYRCLDHGATSEHLGAFNLSWATSKPFITSAFRAECVINVPISSVCVAKSAFESIGGFDPSLRSWEITDFFLRLALEEPHFLVVPTVVASVHETANSASTVTHSHSQYSERYLAKLIERLPSIPRRERAPLLRAAKGMFVTLWQNRDLEPFQRLARRASPHLWRAGLFDRLISYGLLPMPLLRRVRH